MKRHVPVILIIAGLIAGCKLDEAGFKESAVNKNQLLGMWYIKYQSSFTPSIPDSGAYVVTDFTAKDYYLFGNDNICKFSSSDPDTVINARYSYNLSAKRITFGPDIEDIYDISKITTDSLIIKGKGSAEANGQITYTDITIKFARK